MTILDGFCIKLASVQFGFYLTAAAGVEDKQRFNFGHAVKIWLKMAAAATKNCPNSHPELKAISLDG